MEIELRQISVDDTESFRAAVDAVAREHKYIALLEAPPIEQVRNFVKRNIECGYPQIIAVREGVVIGWCNIPPASRAVSAHVGDLFMGLVPEWRGRGLGERLLRHAVYTADTFGFQRIELGVSQQMI
jgi:GNAT superfamily N-acetyltransferase